jgi:hypothetical protein
MKRILLLLALSAVLVLLLSSAALAKRHLDDGMAASRTATATANPTATATATAKGQRAGGRTSGDGRRVNIVLLARTGGPSPAILFALAALVMVGSGVTVLALVRRYNSS